MRLRVEFELDVEASDDTEPHLGRLRRALADMEGDEAPAFVVAKAVLHHFHDVAVTVKETRVLEM